MTTVTLERTLITSPFEGQDTAEGLIDATEHLSALEVARLEVAKIRAVEMRREILDEEGLAAKEAALSEHRRLSTLSAIDNLKDSYSGLSDTEMTAQVLSAIFSEQKLISDKVDEISDNKLLYRARKKFGEFLNRGNKVSKVVKKIGTTAILTTVGAAVGGVAGMTVGAGAGRSIQSISEHTYGSVADSQVTTEDFVKNGSQDIEEEPLDGETPLDRLEELFNRAHNLAEDKTQSIVDRERQRYHLARNKAVKDGMIAAATSLMVGSIFREVITVANAVPVPVDASGSYLAAGDVVSATASPTEFTDLLPEYSFAPDSHVPIGVETPNPSHFQIEIDSGTEHYPIATQTAGVDHIDIQVEDSSHAAIGVESAHQTVELDTSDMAHQPIDAETTSQPGHALIEVDSADQLDHAPIDTEVGQPVHAPVEVESVQSFDFGYGTATGNLLQDVVFGQLDVALSDHDSYLLTLHLMEQTDGNIFDGLDTVWHGTNDVWIMNPGGNTEGLTEEALKVAKEWLGSSSAIGLPSAGV